MHIGNATQGKQVPVRSTQGQICNRLDPRAQRGARTHTYTDELFAHQQAADPGTANQRLQLLPDTRGIQSLHRNAHRIELDVKRIAGNHDAVPHLDDSRNFLEPRGNLLRARLDLDEIRAKQFDLYRLWHRSEIADHVLHQLHRLDTEPRYPRLDLSAQSRHDVLDVWTWPAAQLDEEVALIGLSQTAAQLHTGPSRVSFNFR